MSDSAYKSRESYSREVEVVSQKINFADKEIVKDISGRENDICKGMKPAKIAKLPLRM